MTYLKKVLVNKNEGFRQTSGYCLVPDLWWNRPPHLT